MHRIAAFTRVITVIIFDFFLLRSDVVILHLFSDSSQLTMTKTSNELIWKQKIAVNGIRTHTRTNQGFLYRGRGNPWTQVRCALILACWVTSASKKNLTMRNMKENMKETIYTFLCVSLKNTVFY